VARRAKAPKVAAPKVPTLDSYVDSAVRQVRRAGGSVTQVGIKAGKNTRPVFPPIVTVKYRKGGQFGDAAERVFDFSMFTPRGGK